VSLSGENNIRLPVLFVGHGSPMNALGKNDYTRGWRSMVEDLPAPEAILCVSAHWESEGTLVSTTDRPSTIHDFWGFPEELYRIAYSCPGSPACAREIEKTVRNTHVGEDPERGLDHGAWAVIRWMYPDADVPVFQLSLDRTRPPDFHYRLGRELSSLRDRGVLIIGSGNIVHNLALADMGAEDEAYDWAEDFDSLVAASIRDGQHEDLIEYGKMGRAAQLAIPTNEHYLPLLYVLGAGNAREPIAFTNSKVTLRSVSMTCVRIG